MKSHEPWLMNLRLLHVFGFDLSHEGRSGASVGRKDGRQRVLDLKVHVRVDLSFLIAKIRVLRVVLQAIDAAKKGSMVGISPYE